MPSPVLVVDGLGGIIYGNAAMVDLAGWGVHEAVGTNIVEHLHPEDREWVADAFVRLTATPEDRERNERRHWAAIHFRMMTHDGTVVPLEVTGASGLDDDAVGGVIYDVRPARTQDLLGSVLDGIASGVLVRDLLSLVIETIATPPLELDAAVLEPDGSGAYRVVAATTDRLIDALSDVADPVPWSQPEHDPTFVDVADLPAPLAGALGSFGYRDFWHIAVESSITPASYRIVACASVHHTPATGPLDRLVRARELAGVVLLRSQTDALLAHAASHDELTQLPNRVGFMQQMAAIDSRDDDAISTLYIDLDAFKPVNDTYGHGAGDQVLQVIAERLRSASRSNDLVARLGGDEFVIVLGRESTEILTHDRATMAADRLLEIIHEPIDLEQGTVRVSASIGVVVAEPTTEIERVLAAADAAMYEAKRAGGSRRHVAPVSQ